MPEEVASQAEIQDQPRRPYEAPRVEAPRVRFASVALGGQLGDLSGPISSGPDLTRVATALDRLTDRIEASETRTGLAIAGIEHSVRQAVARIEAAERESLAVSSRLDGMAERIDQQGLREVAGPRSAEAILGVYGEAPGQSYPSQAGLAEEVVARLSDRLAEAEGRTTEALEGLRGALAALDHRLRSVEGGASLDVERRLDALAAELGQRVEDARAEAVARLQATSAGGVELRLADMAEHVRAAEQRSAQAIERMGKEVLSLAEALNRRLNAAEQNSAAAVEQVGGEIARIGAVVENRLSRTEQAQADALEKLGAEIGRVTERLTDRIVQSERRTAQAIDDVGEQVARVTERMENRHERLANDLAERLRESERRASERLEDARSDLETSLAGARERLAEVADEDAPPVHPFGPELFARAEAATPDMAEDTAPFAGDALASVGTDDFAPLAELPEDLDADLDEDFEDRAAAGEERRPLSTREVIEQARIAARAEAAAPKAAQIISDRRASGRPGARRVFRGLGFRTSARPPSTWQTALMLAGGAAFLSVGAAGVVLMEGPGAGALPQVASIPLPGSAPRAAVALAPQPLGPTAPATGDEVAPELTPARPQPAQDYAAAVRDIESGQAGGLARLKTVAEDGYAPAQFYLAKLYETGVSGVVKNPAEARRWTERAAEGGDRSAMHNLALYYFRGEGGSQDLAAAARWFRKAAEAGVVDSQYNLGLLYQSGSGVERDLAEAYKWFAIAADGGDAEARANAVDLEAKLPASQLAAAERAADAYKPVARRPEIAPQAKASHGATLTMAQRILGKLGYYHGAATGAPSREFKVAVENFQRDHDLPATGALDPSTVSQLSVFTR
ncbi:peptidoglycan-binding protein [Phenylobacterium soli]|uniref:peptidoglycan-binding protein n=1 Tax=Phenylobacterium soli TaxID=2170551 RepID=UPI001057721E|nr:peptidoglycan-binding protein [Phenylobacterium soli]